MASMIADEWYGFAEAVFVESPGNPGQGNTYTYGQTCRDCDDTFDPHYRNGVPCVRAYSHAKNVQRNWYLNSGELGRVEILGRKLAAA